jgi:hypothetical protein
MERKHGCAGCLTILAVVVAIALLTRSTDNSKNNPVPAPTPAPAPLDPHEQHEKRLAELKAERQSKADLLMISLGAEAKIRRDIMIVRDPDLRRLDPFPDPNEEQRLLADLDIMVKENAKSKAELDALDVEIAKEEALGAPSPTSDAKFLPPPAAQASPPLPQVVEHPTDTSQSPVPQQLPAITTSPPAPPAEASKPTSGALCNGPVEVRQNWEFTFRNLPGGQLKFTFDHDAWLPLIHREPDGTQTLIMRSLKPGIQTKCDIRWEVVQ